DVERHAADRCHDTTNPIDARAILPALARVEHQWLAWSLFSVRGRKPSDRIEIPNGLGVPEPVGETCGVGQQMTQEDRPFCRSQQRCSCGIKSVKHLGRAEHWINVGYRRIQ